MNERVPVPSKSNRAYVPSDAAKKASNYYNALSFEERSQLAPLLDHYRQMGLAEANERMLSVVARNNDRIRGIRNA